MITYCSIVYGCLIVYCIIVYYMTYVKPCYTYYTIVGLVNVILLHDCCYIKDLV